MNTPQKLILAAAMALYALTACFIPVRQIHPGSSYAYYHGFWEIQSYDHIQYGQLALWWLLIGFLLALGLALAHRSAN